MKKVLIDATSVRLDAKGVGLYALQLCMRIPMLLGSGWQAIAYTTVEGASILGAQFQGQVLVVPQCTDLYKGLVATPRLIARVQPDVLLRPSEGTGYDYGIPMVTACHDINALIRGAAGERFSPYRAAVDYMKDLLGIHAIKRSVHLITNSDYLKRQISSRYGISQSNISVGYCGVDDVFFNASAPEARRRVKARFGVENYVLTFATGDRREGFAGLPDIVKGLRDKGANIPFIIAGVRNGSSYCVSLERNFQINGLQKGRDFIFVEFIPLQRRSELADLYAAARLYLELSKHEAFGMQLAEALASGVRCVSPLHSGLAEIGGGYVVELDRADPDHIAQRVLEALESDWEPSAGQAGQVRFARRCSWDTTSQVVAGRIMSAAQFHCHSAHRVERSDEREPACSDLAIARDAPRVVMIYVEPTPYILGFIEACRSVWAGPVEAFYIATDLSQAWTVDNAVGGGAVLPGGRVAALRAIWRMLSGPPRGTILHLAGWGHPLLVAALLIGRLRGLHVFIETDTATGQALSGWSKFVKRLVYPSLFRLADHFLPAGKRQAAYLASYGVPKHKITIAQMTVDVAAIQHYVARHGEAARASMRARLGFSGEVKAVLYMSRLEVYKGASDLLDAFADLASRRADVRLMVAGSGGLDSLVRGAAAAHPHISYLRRLSGDKVLDAYAASDIVVVPSRYEGWGLVVNETMACGRPIVATDRVGCVDDLVTHGETGLLVRAEAPHALADALELLVSDDPLREKMGAAATRKIAPWTLQNEAKIVARCWNERCNAS